MRGRGKTGRGGGEFSKTSRIEYLLGKGDMVLNKGTRETKQWRKGDSAEGGGGSSKRSTL